MLSFEMNLFRLALILTVDTAISVLTERLGLLLLNLHRFWLMIIPVTGIKDLECLVDMSIFHDLWLLLGLGLRFLLLFDILIRQICKNVVQVLARAATKGVVVVFDVHPRWSLSLFPSELGRAEKRVTKALLVWRGRSRRE